MGAGENILKLTDKDIEEYIDIFRAHLMSAIKKHRGGDLLFTNHHEAYGVLAEEVHELLHAIQSNDKKEIADEFMDVMISSFWGFASIVERMD